MVNESASPLLPEQFFAVDMRVGTIVQATVFAAARKPAYQLLIDFGPLGQMQSSAQLTEHYPLETLVGLQVIAVVNLPEKRIAGFKSQCLVLAAVNDLDGTILLQPERLVANGSRIC